MVESVDIWAVGLDPPDEEVRRLHRLLSSSERARAGLPPFGPRKRRYVARQGAVREILSAYLGVAAAQLDLRHTAWGRPFVAGHSEVCFSVADSADLALVAVGRSPLGVDVERIRARPIASRSALRTSEFFERWTKLEAVGKALGTGLRQPHRDERPFACLEIDLGPEFAAAVAVEAERAEVSVRPYR